MAFKVCIVGRLVVCKPVGRKEGRREGRKEG
jgi:hypothetical protein